MQRSRLPGIVQGSRHPDWISLYETADVTSLPWHFAEIDPDIKKALNTLAPNKRTILDIGCGLGHQANAMAELGYQVTGIDIAPQAIERAKNLHPNTQFLVDDITDMKTQDCFDVIVDRGCLHVLYPKYFEAYVRNIKSRLNNGGYYFLKLFSNEAGHPDFGPYRFSRLQILRIFSESFNILQIRRTVYFGSTPQQQPSWFCIMRSTEKGEMK